MEAIIVVLVIVIVINSIIEKSSKNEVEFVTNRKNKINPKEILTGEKVEHELVKPKLVLTEKEDPLAKQIKEEEMRAKKLRKKREKNSDKNNGLKAESTHDIEKLNDSPKMASDIVSNISDNKDDKYRNFDKAHLDIYDLDTEDLQNAIILSELLDKPVSLR